MPDHQFDTAEEPVQVLDRVWREHWGRLVALLIAQYRRLDLVEDALADAFEAATRTWPRGGVPANPPAWLLTAARRRVIDRLRTETAEARRTEAVRIESTHVEEVLAMASDPEFDLDRLPDERLRLVLLCAHPTLTPDAAAALTLRLVLGVPTVDIARLFLVSTPTMAARLTRARRRLAGASFDLPTGEELRQRVDTVARVAYLAFTAGYAPSSGADVTRAELAEEAIHLVRLVRALLPDHHPDLDALLALMMLQHSRRDARVEAGEVVLLPDQDRARWHHDEIEAAVRLLAPLMAQPPTPWLLQALIAAEHAVAARAEDTDWVRIAATYAELEAVTPSPVVRLNRAVAVAEADGPLAGLALLDALSAEDLPGHRLPSVRAELLARAGRTDQARAAYAQALASCDNDPDHRHLSRRLAALGRGPGTVGFPG